MSIMKRKIMMMTITMIQVKQNEGINCDTTRK